MKEAHEEGVINVRLYIAGFIWYHTNMSKLFDFQVKNNATYGRGYVYSLQYHIVWCTKNRNKILLGAEDDIKSYIETTAKDLDIKILAMEIMPDYIHLLIDAKPQLRLSDAVKVMKGNTARWLYMNHPEIKESLRGCQLWNPSYFTAIVSEKCMEQVTEYIANQKQKG